MKRTKIFGDELPLSVDHEFALHQHGFIAKLNDSPCQHVPHAPFAFLSMFVMIGLHGHNVQP
jgi:hypothetical protein